MLASITIPIAAGTAYPSAVTGFGRRFLAFITPLAAVSEIGEPMDLSPAPTAEQLAELDEELRPLREENPDVPDDVIMGSVPAKHVIFEWRRRHGLLSDEAS